MFSGNLIKKLIPENQDVSIESYKSCGGFIALEHAIKMDADRIINEIKESGLRGRGGAGFSTASKWLMVDRTKETYLLCNADEGEPGTFKDRYIIEHSPFLLLEGMIISALALNCHKAFIYVRGEYQESFTKLIHAVATLKENGIIGKKVLTKDFELDIEIKIGGGSYVVGDETALINSVMGNRGFPLLKPPYPTESGLWGKPTVVNNVETFACVTTIVKNGADVFKQMGEKNCTGTKLFSVSGSVNMPGVYELPMGITVEEVIEVAGGVKGEFKAVQIGGTIGGIYNKDGLKLKLDYNSMSDIGGVLGSGAITVINSNFSMAHILEITANFFSKESCGQCFPCRYGSKQVLHIAKNVLKNRSNANYKELLEAAVNTMEAASFCPFGKSVALPIRTLLENFGEEIDNFIMDQRLFMEA